MESCTGLVIKKTLAQVQARDAGTWFNERLPQYARPRVPTPDELLARYGDRTSYRTPGQLCSAVGMLAGVEAGWPSHATADVASPRIELTDAETRERMSGKICRCAAHPNIVVAIRDVAGGGRE